MTRRISLAVAALALGSFAASLFVQLHWFPHLSKNNDEAVYLFQASLYRAGHVSLPAAGMGPSFRPWMSGPIGDRLVMVFPPGWPALLALGTLALRSFRLVVALATAFAVVAVYLFTAELTRSRRTALLTAALAATSPFFLVLGSMVLCYVIALGLDCMIAWFVLRAVREGRPALLAGAGALTGVLFSMRPLDALLVSTVFGVFALWRWRSGDDRRTAARAVGWALVGALPFVIAAFAYNAATTHHPFEFPLHANGGDNRFGFGARRITLDAPWFTVTPSMMWHATLQNLRNVPLWVVGGVLAAPIAVLGLVRLWRRSRQAAVLLIVIGVLWPAAHSFYWGTYFVAVGVRDYGPFYYLPVILPIATFTAEGLRWMWERSRPVAGVVAAVCLAVTFGYLLPKPLARARTHTTAVSREVRLVDALPGRSVTIVPASQDGAWVLHVRGYFRNAPDLSGRRIYAADTGADNLLLFDRFPDRGIYNLWGAVPRGREGAQLPVPRIDRLHRVSGASLAVDTTLHNVMGAPVVVAYLGSQGRVDRCVLDRASSPGRTYSARWVVHADGSVRAPEGCEQMLDPLPMDDTSRGFVAAGFAVGQTRAFSDDDRYEYFIPVRYPGPNVEVAVPGVQRRTVAGPAGVKLGTFNGDVSGVVDVGISALAASSL